MQQRRKGAERLAHGLVRANALTSLAAGTLGNSRNGPCSRITYRSRQDSGGRARPSLHQRRRAVTMARWMVGAGACWRACAQCISGLRGASQHRKNGLLRTARSFWSSLATFTLLSSSPSLHLCEEHLAILDYPSLPRLPARPLCCDCDRALISSRTTYPRPTRPTSATTPGYPGTPLCPQSAFEISTGSREFRARHVLVQHWYTGSV